MSDIRTIFRDTSRVLLTNACDKAQQARLLTRARVDLEDYELRRRSANYLKPHFDHFVCFGYGKEMKPHLKIHPTATEISGLSENCKVAVALGMQAIHFESPSQLHRELSHLGIQAA